MIARLIGTIHPLGLDEVVVDVGGVGYHVHVPLGTPQRVKPGEDGRVTLLIHTAVREDAIQLFGFATEQEKAVYRKLINVSGVGPRTGLNVLSDLSISELVSAVRNDDYKPLTKVSGIGKKTAERLLLELRNKLDDLPAAVKLEQNFEAAVDADEELLADLRSALINLDYKPAMVDDVVIDMQPLAADGMDLQSLVREALKRMRG